MKRFFDFSLAAGLSILLLPVFLIVTLAILLTDGPPVLFKQARPGRAGKPFILVKFRTMSPKNVASTSNEERITWLGKFLRKSSLDELPELWNVLVGDMSLVGPRPLLMEYLPLYNRTQSRRHEVRPGLTGLAQVRGRNKLTWEQRFALDVWYVDNQSFWLDLLILAKTLTQVLSGYGVSPNDGIIMHKFKGSHVDNKDE